MIENPKLPHSYTAYAESGTDYIKILPSHWKIERAKWLFTKEERAVRVGDEVVTCFRDGQVTLRRLRRTEGFTNALQEHGYQGIRKGDLIIHAMDAFAGAIGVSEADGKSSPVYSACTPRKPELVDSNYYAYFMRDLALSGYLLSLAKGIRERSTDFRFKDFAVLELPKPPVAEQKAIVKFLDQKNTQIAKALRFKEQQIALLKEREQILIQNAVTRGLNSEATMRDSKVEWIGSIPAHWEVMKLKFLFREVNKRTRTGQETLFSLRMDKGLVPHEEVSDKHIADENLVDYKIVRPGQMVMNRMRAAIGIFGLSKRYGLVSPDYAIFDIGSRANPDFFLKLFKLPLLGTQFRLNSKGLGTGSSGFMRLYTENFGDIKVALPPLEEQAEIADFIDAESTKTKKTTDLLTQKITKLKEYKAAVVNSAVTGKIKVSGVIEPKEKEETLA